MRLSSQVFSVIAIAASIGSGDAAELLPGHDVSSDVVWPSPPAVNGGPDGADGRWSVGLETRPGASSHRTVDQGPAPDLPPGWQRLADIDNVDRADVAIRIVAASDASDAELRRVSDIERAWGDGHYDDAVDALRDLEADGASLGMLEVIRTTPVSAAPRRGSMWGNDYEFPEALGSEPVPTLMTRMEADPSTGVLYAVVAGTTHRAGFFSLNGGDTWLLESWAAPFPGELFLDTACVLHAGYFYSTLVNTFDRTQLRITRYSSTTGLRDFDYSDILDYPSEVSEVAMDSDHEEAGIRLYVAASLDDNTVDLHFTDDLAEAFTAFETPITNAARSMDIAYNPGWSTDDGAGVILTYIDVVDDLRLAGFKISGWQAPTVIQSDVGLFASVAAYQNRIMIAYETYADATYGIGYHVNYEGTNGLWYFGDVSTDPTSDFYRPAITARGGGGFRVVYGSDATLRAVSRYRDYGSGPGEATFGSVEVISDGDIAADSERSVELISASGDPAAWGALFIAPYPELGGVFDRTEPVVSVDPPSADGRRSLVSWPMPVRTGDVRIAWSDGSSLDADRFGVFDAAGRRVATLPVDASASVARWDGRADDGHAVAPGVYFLRGEGAAQPIEGKITVVH